MRLKGYWPLYTSCIGVILTWAACTSDGCAATVAMQDFDGGEVNFIGGFDPLSDNLDGGGGDFFGVGNTGVWPQGYPPGMPFGLADDSVVSVSDPANAAFPTDNEGLVGQNRAPADNFFAISDTRDFEGAAQPSASWTFNIAGYSDLNLSIDLGAQASDSSGGFPTTAAINFTYQIDGGPIQTAFDLAANSSFGGYAYRAMDSGTVPAVGANGPLEATGPNAITKILADTGMAASDTFLNKTPASGNSAGMMDTFTTSINGTGSQLVLTMTADLDFEAMGFDNIKISCVPEPGTLVLALVGSLAAYGRKRRCRKV